MKKTLHVFAIACISLLALPTAAQVPAYVPTDGLAGWWPFNGNANDESGNGNDGAVNGATLVEDRSGNADAAYDFDGVNDFIQMINSGPNGNTNVTLSFWMKTIMAVEPGPIGGVGNIFGYGANDISQDGRSFIVTVNGSASVGNCDQSISFDSYGATLAKSDIFSGEWNFYTIVNDTTAGNNVIFQKIYKNGVEMNNVCYSSPGVPASNTNFSNATPIRMGKFYGDFCQNCQVQLPLFFAGSLDDIGIWSRALSEQEIQNLYTGTTPPPCVSLPTNLQQGLVGYWPFCGNANDESGNGNDGTVNGATLTEDRFEYSNKAYQFNGDTDDISVEVSSPVEINRSISFWAKVDSGTMNVNPSRNLIALGNDFNITFGDWGDNGKSAIGVHSGIQWVADTTVTDDGNWHFYSVIITNGNSDNLAFYQDGELLNGRINFGGFNCAESNSILKIGSGYAEGDNLNGTLDDIGIWNRALTPEEVQELYTIDACTFTIYDTVYTYETIYDTVTTYLTVTDTLLIDITFTGFEGQPSWLNTVTVFPNPASDHITIDYNNFALMAGYNTVITDAAGATVYSSAVNNQQAYIDINAWGAAGVYYMSVYDANGELVAVRHIVLE